MEKNSPTNCLWIVPFSISCISNKLIQYLFSLQLDDVRRGWIEKSSRYCIRSNIYGVVRSVYSVLIQYVCELIVQCTGWHFFFFNHRAIRISPNWSKQMNRTGVKWRKSALFLFRTLSLLTSHYFETHTVQLNISKKTHRTRLFFFSLIFCTVALPKWFHSINHSERLCIISLFCTTKCTNNLLISIHQKSYYCDNISHVQLNLYSNYCLIFFMIATNAAVFIFVSIILSAFHRFHFHNF